MTDAPPLCVDLDGSFLRTDSLVEGLLVAAKLNPAVLMKCFGRIARGDKAGLKTNLSDSIDLDFEYLPYRPEVVTYLHEQKAAGRRILLVTGAAQRWADQVANHHGFFDESIGTDSDHNLTGRNKANLLVDRFGEGGFDYLGDSRADEPVWAKARRCLIVSDRPSLNRAWDQVFARRSRPALGTLTRALRPHQWAKNLLIFVPLLLAHRFNDTQAWVSSLATFASFSLCASGVYLLNDLLDLRADRRHVNKRRRPFASGELPLAWGVILPPVLFASSALVALQVSVHLLALMGCYVVTTSLYSFWLKRIVLVDVMLLAGLYTLRIFAGHVSLNITASSWLLLFSVFFFFSLANLKRFIEMAAAPTSTGPEPQKIDGRGYLSSDVEVIRTIGLSSGLVAVMIFGLYLDSMTSQQMYSRPQVLWGSCLILLFWICRMWIKGARREVPDDPIIFALKDRTSILLGLCAAAFIGIAL